MTVRYPDSLPIPATYVLEPGSQVLVGGGDESIRSLRRRSRQPWAKAQVSFHYTRSEYSAFKTWWESDLLFGHKLFWINLPSAGGITWHLVRFTDRYTAKLDGHRSWTISSNIEIRDRAFNPVILDYTLVLTSAMYPIPIIDELDSSASLNRGYVLAPTSDFMEGAASLISGSLTVVVSYLTHSMDPESFDNAAALQSGSLDTVVAYLTYDIPAESLDNSASIIAGSLTVVVAYLDYDIQAESLDNTATLLSGTLT